MLLRYICHAVLAGAAARCQAGLQHARFMIGMQRQLKHAVIHACMTQLDPSFRPGSSARLQRWIQQAVSKCSWQF